jgi:hypothetical protein
VAFVVDPINRQKPEYIWNVEEKSVLDVGKILSYANPSISKDVENPSNSATSWNQHLYQFNLILHIYQSIQSKECLPQGWCKTKFQFFIKKR